MKSFKINTIFSLLIIFIAFQFVDSSLSSDYITPEEASVHIGESQTVCGNVASTYYSYRSKGRPTFINLNKPYPKQIFTALIWGSDREKFEGDPDKIYRDKSICVSGPITSYKGTPQIIVRSPSQIKIK